MSKIFANKKLVLTVLCLFLLYVTWGMVYLSIKFALESFPPVMLSGLRYTCAGSVLLLWSYVVKGDWQLPTLKDLKIIGIGSLGMIVVCGSLLNISELYVSSGVTALLLGSTPLWMVIAGWLINHEQRPSVVVFIGLAGGFCGIIMLAVSTGIEQSGSVLGIICVFGSLSGWVFGSLFLKGHRVSLPMVKSLGFQMFMGGLFMVIFANFIGEYDNFSFGAVSLKSWLSFIHLVCFGSLVGYTAYLWLLYNTPTPIAVSYAYVEPVLAVALGAIFAGEIVTNFTVFACVLIIASVFFVMWGKREAK